MPCQQAWSMMTIATLATCDHATNKLGRSTYDQRRATAKYTLAHI